MMPSLILRAAAAVAAAAAVVAGDASYVVHKHSASARRPAAWARTKCGTPGTGADIITQWGATVTPNSVLPEYPRPQLVRGGDASWVNLNGLWEFQLAASTDPVPFGQTLNQTILVPFPLEACLSGAFAWPTYSKWSFYKSVVDTPFSSGLTLLHFGAVDWNSTVYVNGRLQGTHIGGYDGFTYDVTSALAAPGQPNEIIVAVYDPSDEGVQPHGKQRISAIPSPGGDTYTPTSGIWQTVWLENVPSYYVSEVRVRGDTQNLYLTVSTQPASAPGLVNLTVSLGGSVVTTASGDTFTPMVVPIPNPSLWSPTSPTLYDLAVTVTEPSTGNTDTITSYFGMRTVSLVSAPVPPSPPTGPRVGYDNAGGDMPGSPFTLPKADYNLCWAACNTTAGCTGWSYGVPNCGGDGAQPQCWLKSSPGGWSQNQCRVAGDQGRPGGSAMRPAINNKPVFLAGWLDQGWWPDGEYTAPTDAALAFDLQSILTFGLNSVRMHQKVNSERWYYYADKLGIAVMQDAVQKYGGATKATIEPFLADLKAMIDGRGNHPSIIQWEVFNEGDCVGVFPNVTAVVDWVEAYDPSRLVDTNSGGPANSLGVGDVNDIHSYPYPGNPLPSATQYAMIGEFGGIGAFVTGHEWTPGQCGTYLPAPDPATEAAIYVNMTKLIIAEKKDVSVCIYTQITDVERECDGFLSMDRTNKFDAATTAAIAAANAALISA